MMRFEEAKDEGALALEDGARVALSRTLFSIMKDGAFFCDRDFVVRHANGAFVALTGLDPSASPARLAAAYPGQANAAALANAQAALRAIGCWEGELERVDADGRPKAHRLTIAASSAAAEAAGQYYAGVIRDLSPLLDAERRLAWSLGHDELTGLPIRALFVEALGQTVAAAEGGGTPLAVAVVDLDDFKRYNTDYGRDEGDAILAAAAKRLKGLLPPGGYLARSGGDEFSCFARLKPGQDAGALARILRDALDEPLRTGRGSHRLRASVGASSWPRDGESAEELLAAADLALQGCKEQGKDGVLCYDLELRRERGGRALLEAELRAAIDGQSLSVHYQPVLNLADGSLYGVEALARWRHPSRGLVRPDEFIPLAEETGLILSLGELVLGKALRQGSAWCRGESAALRVAVNVSAVQLARPGFARGFLESAGRAGLSPTNLSVEITESALVAKIDEANAALGALRAVGVSVSVDDFGTGYSSLSYIKDLPVDQLKIDKGFVKEMARSSVAREIVTGTVSLAHKLGLNVVAEGVETAEQFYLLRELGCDYAQGFLFGKALPASELEGLYLDRGGSRYSSVLYR